MSRVRTVRPGQLRHRRTFPIILSGFQAGLGAVLQKAGDYGLLHRTSHDTHTGLHHPYSFVHSPHLAFLHHRPVALGWTLEAEPVISREVRGLPDEQSFLYDKSNLTRLPDIYKARIGQGTCDVLEDIFHMKLIGASADFVLQQADSHQFIPRLFHRPELKVSLGESETKVNDSFNNQLRVIDGTGNKYLFGQDANAREETSLVNSYSAQTAWKASEITSPDGDRISFSYYTDLPDEVYKGAYDYYATEDNYPDYHVPSPGTPPHPGYWAGVNGQKNYYYMNGTTIQPGGTPKPVFEKWGGRG